MCTPVHGSLTASLSEASSFVYTFIYHIVFLPSSPTKHLIYRVARICYLSIICKSFFFSFFHLWSCLFLLALPRLCSETKHLGEPVYKNKKNVHVPFLFFFSLLQSIWQQQNKRKKTNCCEPPFFSKVKRRNETEYTIVNCCLMKSS